MNIEQIEKSLMKLFNEPKEIWQKRHIIFWYDEKGDFTEEVDNLTLPEVKLHKLTDNFFYTKFLLEKEDTENNYLIYSSSVKPDYEHNWLLDILLYSKEFSADRSSVILNDLWITDLSMKDTIESHVKFFSSKKRQDDFIKLNVEKDTIKSIELSLLATITNQNSQNFDDILREIFTLWFEDNKYLIEFDKYNLSELFWKYVKIYFSYDKAERNLSDLFISLLITNIKLTGNYRLPSHLDIYGNLSNHSNFFIDHFMNHKSDYKKYREYCDNFSGELDIFSISTINLNEIRDIETISGIDKTILITIARAIQAKKTDFDTYIDIIHTRQTKHWYDLFQDQYEALLNAIEVFKFKEKYENGFNHIDAKELFIEYTQEYYKMDSFYRLFNFHYDKAQMSLKDNYLNILQKEIEWIYTNWFLSDLTEKWIALLKVDDINNWFIKGVEKQTNFYQKEVVPVLSGQNIQRVFVIISDALRYECAMELKNLLEKERGVSAISSMQWVIPSYTKLWMASLLPHEEITIEDTGRVLVDNIDSTSTEWRWKILSKKTTSIAITWKELSWHSQNEARELFKDINVVYIYHNIIDSTGDDAKTEHKTFEACDAAIIELRDIVKKITNSWNWVNVLITADHGFIYKIEPLEESDKISLEKLNKIDNNRRFLLTKDEKNIDGTIKIDMNYLGNPGISAILPNGNSRFKIQWWGSNFVHGSLSLQEIVIPVVSFRYQKELKSDGADFKKEVEIILNNTNRLITTNMFSLVFYQTQPMAWKLLEGNYRISLWDMNDGEPQQVSDEKVIIANRISDKVEDRTFRVNLTLKKFLSKKDKVYKLRVFSDGKVPIEKDGYDFKIDILIQNDFDNIF
jgi:uncharacterized protein (TIGR02687 family)